MSTIFDTDITGATRTGTAGALEAQGIGIGTLQSIVSGNTQLTFFFDDTVAGATSYNIYYNTTSPATKETGTKITGVSNGHVLTGLTNGVEIFAVYTASDGVNESTESNELSATPNANPPNTTAVLFGVQ